MNIFRENLSILRLKIIKIIKKKIHVGDVLWDVDVNYRSILVEVIEYKIFTIIWLNHT